MSEKIPCERPDGSICPKECPGMLGSFLSLSYGDGLEIQVCQNPEYINHGSEQIDYSDITQQTIVIYGKELPGPTEFEKIVAGFGQ